MSKTAYLNNKAHEIKAGETMITFARRVMGKDAIRKGSIFIRIRRIFSVFAKI